MSDSNWVGCALPVLRELNRAAREPALAGRLRARVHEAAEYERGRAEAAERLRRARQKHAREILKDVRTGGTAYTHRNRLPRPKTGAWNWHGEVVEGLPPSEGDVWGWFPLDMLAEPKEVEDTPAGSVALLSLLHDGELIEKHEPYNTVRIVTDEADRAALAAAYALFCARLDEYERGRPGAALKELAGRWEAARPDLAKQTQDALRSGSAEAGTTARGTTGEPGQSEYDLFICHASEDKAEVVIPLADELTKQGLRVWVDYKELTLGDRLRRRIDDGLRCSRFGMVIVSPHFFAKVWPQSELDGLVALEMADGRKRVLPIWHDVDHAAVAQRSPMLGGRLAANWAQGLPKVVEEILRAVRG